MQVFIIEREGDWEAHQFVPEAAELRDWWILNNGPVEHGLVSNNDKKVHQICQKRKLNINIIAKFEIILIVHLQ